MSTQETLDAVEIPVAIAPETAIAKMTSGGLVLKAAEMKDVIAKLIFSDKDDIDGMARAAFDICKGRLSISTLKTALKLAIDASFNFHNDNGDVVKSGPMKLAKRVVNTYCDEMKKQEAAVLQHLRNEGFGMGKVNFKPSGNSATIDFVKPAAQAISKDEAHRRQVVKMLAENKAKREAIETAAQLKVEEAEARTATLEAQVKELLANQAK